MSQLEAMAKSVAECCSLSSSGTILGECQLSSSSQCSGITCPQPVVAMAHILSSSHVLFDRPFQFPFSTHHLINYDTMISLPSPLGVPAIPTSSLSSSFATNSRTTSDVAVMRRDDPNKDHSQNTPHDNGAASSVSSATPATVSVMMTITSEWTHSTTVALESTSPGSVQPSPTGTVTSAPSTLTSGSTGPGSVQPSPTGIVVSAPSTVTLASTRPGSVQRSKTGTVVSPSTATSGSTNFGSVQPSPTRTVTFSPSTSKSR